MGVRLNAETSAARLVGRLSRAVGRGGGTTLPGKLLWKVDPGALDALAARLPAGVAVVSATNGKTTTSAMLARILGSRYRLAWNNSGANLASGVASTLLSATDADLGLLEVDEFALPEVMRRVQPAGRLARQPLPRPARPLRRARAHRRALARRGRRRSLPPRRSSSTPTTRSSPSSRTGARGALRFGVDDPRLARPALQHAADSKYCVRCGAPYDYAAAYVGHLGDYRCPNCGHAGRRSTSRPARSTCRRSTRPCSISSRRPARRGSRLPLPGLYNVYNALAAAAVGARPRRVARRDRRRARDVHGGVRPLRADRGGRPADPDAADQEPGRRERGDPDARGGRRARDARDRAQRPHRRRPRRLVDLGRRLRAAARARRADRRERRARGRARAALHLRRLPAATGSR